jgi:threonine aldolase
MDDARTIAQGAVRLDVDGPWHSPRDYARRLAAAAAALDAPDSYGEGAVVQAAEAALAAALGKERAVLLPTGTLTNLLALDRLCGRHRRRVLVHPDSHAMMDVGDGLASLAGITPVAAEPVGAGFAGEAVSRAAAVAASGKVAQGLGAVVVETPVRRLRNAAFPKGLLDGVVAAAAEAGVPLHLDGARLPVAAAAEGVTMAAWCRPYATVYLSLWKMLGLPFGAALAGPAELLEGIEHDRRRHGGAMPQLWPLAALVLAELGRLEADWADALARLDRVRALLEAAGDPAPEPVGTERTNTLWLRPRGMAAQAYRDRCAAAGLKPAEAVGDRVLIRANATWTAAAPEALADALVAAARGG